MPGGSKAYAATTRLPALAKRSRNASSASAPVTRKILDAYSQTRS